MKILQSISFFFAILSCASVSNAATLYASTSAGGPGELYIINQATGAVVQDVGPLNDSLNVNYPITGLAFSPVTGVLYGSTGNSGAVDARLVTINPATAQVTVIGQFNAGPVSSDGSPSTMADIAFDAAGNLYGVGSIGGPQIYQINTVTGKATVVGSTGLTSTSGGGLAISPGGVFYGAPTSNQFGTYNSITGTYTNIANPVKPAGTGAYAALDFDRNVLYGLNVGPGSSPPTHIVTIDPATGAVTDIGASVNALDAIAWRMSSELIHWANSSGGNFQVGANWSPQYVPTGVDVALFDIGNAAYSVTGSQDLTASRLIVGADNVTLNLGTKSLHLLADNFTDGYSQVLRVANDDGDVGSLHLTSGTLSTRGLVVSATGGTGNTTGLLEITGPNTTLEVTGTFDENQIGGAGNDSGEVRVTEGAKLIAPQATLLLGRNGGSGKMLVSGLGSHLQVDTFYVGLIGHGELTVQQAAIVDFGYLAIANQDISPTGTVAVNTGGRISVSDAILVGGAGIGTLVIDGGTVESMQQMQVGADEGSGQVMVRNGGVLKSSKGDSSTSATIGAFAATAQGSATVTGIGSQWIQDGNVSVGSIGSGTLDILDHGYVECVDSQVARTTTATADVQVGGVGSHWSIRDRLVVGGAFASVGGTANVEVTNGGNITAGQLVHVWSTGSLDLTGGGSVEIGTVGTAAAMGTLKVGTGGTLSGSGHVLANVLVDHGTVSPGASPDLLTITGNMTQLAGSILNLEIAGATIAQYDRLNVSGNMSVVGNVSIQFTGGYTPALGTKFDLFTVGGTFDISGATVQYASAPSALSFRQSFSSGVFSITAIPALLGDYNLSGTVDNGDYLIWRQQFGSLTGAYTGADGNGNGVVDAADYVIWRKSSAPSGGTSLAAIPEPNTICLFAMGISLVFLTLSYRQ